MEQKPDTPSEPIDVTKTDRFASIKAFIDKRPPKKRLAIVAAVSGGVLIAALLVFQFGINRDPVLPEEPEIAAYVPPLEPVISPLTGVEVNEDQAARPVTAVIIENSIDARPQSGLEEAGIVFEAIAEGGITRFMALYQEARPGNIGPIRSARPYYVEWAKGYDARYVHSGGSGEALALIQSIGVKDMDHGKLGERVASRVSYRFAPHNVYTDFDRIDAVGAELGFTTSEFVAFERKEAEPPTPEAPATASALTFNVSSANYNSAYTYDPAAGDYKRTMAGLPHSDQDNGRQISPEVVVAMYVSRSINPNGIHTVYGSIGSGEALVFQDGKVINATWRKVNQSASLELLDAAGQPLALNPGQTWITAIDPGRVSYTP